MTEGFESFDGVAITKTLPSSLEFNSVTMKFWTACRGGLLPERLNSLAPVAGAQISYHESQMNTRLLTKSLFLIHFVTVSAYLSRDLAAPQVGLDL
jgi:hypothetical protein